MSHLDAGQRAALQQLQSIVTTDDDVAISILTDVGWDVQRALDIIFTETQVDDTHVVPPTPAPSPYHQLITRPIFAIFTYPLHFLSNILRFLFSILRIPVPQFRFFSSLSFYRPLPRRRTHGGPDHWIRELEEETGAICPSTARARASTAATTAMDAPGPSSLSSRPRPYDEVLKVLPDFVLGSYDEALRICQHEARIGCIVLVSEEHDDVPEFKRTTLTDPDFVRLLQDNNAVVWGGDVRDQQAWSAAERLQATTYPFVAFLALQPRRNPASSSSTPRASQPPLLTVLSRHQGPSSSGGPTAPDTLVTHLTTQVIPRVQSFLDRIKAQHRDRDRDRRIREEQDAAFRETARRDRERIEARVEEERVERERRGREMEEEENRRRWQEEIKREKAQRVEWRKWTRRTVAGAKEPQKGVKVAVRLPNGGRVIRTFEPGQSLTTLYAFVDAQIATGDKQEDPVVSPAGDAWEGVDLERCLERQAAGKGAWWEFRLALAYPRKEIPWQEGVRLADVEALKGGGQVVVEMTGNARERETSGGEDEYETESDEE